MNKETQSSYHRWKEGLAKQGKTPADMLKFARENYDDEAYCQRLERLIEANGDLPPSEGQGDKPP